MCMFKDFCNLIRENKNVLMLFTVLFYIIALISVFKGTILLCALIITLLFIICIIKDYLPLKIIIIWTIIFYIGIINTQVRIKETSTLHNLAPLNSVIYGKIISLPQKTAGKQKFFFRINKIEYDNFVKDFLNEKVLVTVNSDDTFNIYDSYKIRGRLSTPFKAGNPSQFDYGNYLRNHNSNAVFYARNPYNMRDSDEPCYKKYAGAKTYTEKFLQSVNNYREHILKIHSEYIPSPNLEILGGIVFGDDAISPPENIKQSFINSGLLHILAASGMNVAFIFSFFFFFFNLVKLNYKVNTIICMFAVLTYVFMTGLGASVVRAALMLLFVLAGKLIDRDAHRVALLSFVALLMLIYNPMYLTDVGFQLSFVVTLGIIVAAPYIVKSQNKIIEWIIGTISIPIIAQLWVMPIQIYYFNNISLYAVFANIMSVPLLSAISFGGFVSSLLSAITPLAHIICRIFDFFLNPMISILIQISEFWGHLPNAAIQTTHPGIVQILIYYSILLSIIALIAKVNQKYVKILKISIPILILVLFISVIKIPNSDLEITAFDVGNADAFLIKTPDDKYLMIDTGKSGYNGGKSQAEYIILKYFKDNGIKNLETIVITHFDNDHCGGAVDLIKNLNVKNIYVNSLNHQSYAAKDIYKIANERNVQINLCRNNQTIYENGSMKMVNFISSEGKEVTDNENSILTLLTYNDFSMLFTGDSGIKAFNKLKSSLPNDVTVLKVGHHGAPGTINKQMAEYFNPKYSVISTGENKFGHPSVYTLGLLRNSKILRTDTNNSIRIAVNKNKMYVQTYDSEVRRYKTIDRY